MNFKSLDQVNMTDNFFVCLIPDGRLARKSKFLKIINETQFGKTESTEFLIEMFRNGKRLGTNLLYAYEIGIGYTKKEAKENYGKFKYCDHPEAISTYDRLEDVFPPIKSEV
jgi:hypothetical protein